MLKQRIITAVILIAITLGVLFYMPPAWFCLLTGLVTLGAAWEWTNLMGLRRISVRLLYLVIMSLTLFNALFIHVSMILAFSVLWWLLALVLVVAYPRGSQRWARGAVWRGLMGILVLLPCWVAINDMRNQHHGVYALIFLFVLIWGADSVAYFTGNALGKHKLAAAVSPGKSIEGVIGALVFAVLLTVVALWVGQTAPGGWVWAILLSLVTVLFSVLGDLFESMLKRKVGLKDSGHLLPGHGGLLDRIDSLTAAAPIFAFGALLLGLYL